MGLLEGRRTDEIFSFDTLERSYLWAAGERLGVPPEELVEVAWETNVWSLPAQTVAPATRTRISRNETKQNLPYTEPYRANSS